MTDRLLKIGYVEVLPFAVVELMRQRGRLASIVEFERFRDAPQLESSIHSGEIDIGFMGVTPLYDLISRGAQLSILATTTFQTAALFTVHDLSAASYMAQSLSPSERVRHLCTAIFDEFKRPPSIATLSRQSVSNGILHCFLKQSGIELGTVKIQNIPEADLVALAVNQQADLFLTREPVVSKVRALGHTFQLVCTSEELFPGKAPGIMAIRQEAKHDGLIQAQQCVADLILCMKEINADPHEAARVISKGGKQYDGNDLYLQKYTADPREIAVGCAALRDAMLELGCLSENTRSIDIERYIDSRLYERAVQTLIVLDGHNRNSEILRP